MHSVHVYNWTGLEVRVKLDRHAETTKHHVCITVLCAKCLVGHLKTRGAINSAINPGYLQTGRTSLHTPHDQFSGFYQNIQNFTAFLLLCGYGPLAH